MLRKLLTGLANWAQSKKRRASSGGSTWIGRKCSLAVLLMNAWDSMKLSSAMAVAVLLVAAKAQAVVAYNFPVTPDRTSASGSYELANIFQVGSQDILVTKVGAADYGAPGFIGTVPVAIYSWSGSQWNQVSGTYHDFTGTPSDLEGGARFYTLPTSVTLNAGGVYAIFGANFGVNNPYWDASVRHTDINGAATFGGGSAITMGAVFGSGTDRGWFTGGSTLPANISGGNLVNYGSTLFGAPGTPSFAGATFDFTPVPEAAAFGAASIGLLGLVYVGRYARLRRMVKVS
jgi:hypothetical protein